MNIRAISRNIGIALIVDAVFMFVSVIVSALNGYDESFSPLLLSGILTFTTGVFPIIFVSEKQAEINIREGFAIIFFAWFLSCIFGMMPYALYGQEFSLINSWFESVSGFTATGATVLQDIEALPRGLLFWRSSTHYIGGLGVVLFMMIILPSIGSVKLKMSKVELVDVSKVNYNFKSNHLVKVIMSVYFGLTTALTLLLMVAGMGFFDAVNHAFCTVSTGGFSTRNASIGAFGSRWIEFIIMAFMLLSSLHFGLIYTSVTGRNLKLFKNPITKFFLLSIVVAVLLVAIDLVSEGAYKNPGEALWAACFNVVSIGTSSGFTINDTSVWPLFSILILIYIGIQCGCSGSTTGGMKADRVWILMKSAKSQILQTLHPNAVVPVRVGNSVADKEIVSSVSIFAILFFALMFICAVVYAAFGMDLTDSFTSSWAMLSNVGPAFGNIGSVSNYAFVPDMAKFVMGIEMITGRVSIYPVIMLFFMFGKRF